MMLNFHLPIRGSVQEPGLRSVARLTPNSVLGAQTGSQRFIDQVNGDRHARMTKQAIDGSSLGTGDEAVEKDQVERLAVRIESYGAGDQVRVVVGQVDKDIPLGLGNRLAWPCFAVRATQVMGSAVVYEVSRPGHGDENPIAFPSHVSGGKRQKSHMVSNNRRQRPRHTLGNRRGGCLVQANLSGRPCRK